MWIIASILLEALVYAAAAVFVRRRFESEGLIVLAIAGAVILSILIALVGPVAREFDGGGLQLPVVGTIGGVVVASVVVHRFILKNPDPDPLPEIAIGAGAFVGGFIAGFTLAGPTVLVIG